MLDEFGPIGAIRNQNLSLGRTELSVELTGQLPPLSAALEVALYRIATEAVHNVVQHAHAAHCYVTLRPSAGNLTLTVRDDGTGVPATYAAGAGLISMRERAVELGGRLTVNSAPDGGTEICTTIPYRPDS